MTTRTFATSGVGSRGPTLDDADFTLSYLPLVTVVSGGSIVDSTTLDRNIRTTTGATVKNEAVVTPLELVFGTFARGLTITSLTPSIVTITQDEYEVTLTRVSNGTARILYSTPWIAREISIPISLSGGATAVQFLSYATSSLAKYSSDILDTKIAASQEQNRFTALDHNAPLYTINEDAWPDIDMSCHQVWNSHTQGPQGVAISPRHTISPHHYTASTGSTVRFIGNDGSVIQRTISNQVQIGSTDIRLNLLSSDLPATVVPAKVLPATYDDFLPSIKTVGSNFRVTYTVPGFFINKFCNAVVAEIGLGTNATYLWSPLDTNPSRHALYTTPVPGDSGSPLFIIVNGELVVLTTLYSPGYGPAIHDYQTAINAAMTSLGGGYQLTNINLSSFTDFS